MTITLESFGAFEPARVTLPGSGGVADMRPLSMAEVAAIERAKPRPLAPYGKDPEKGSHAAKIARHDDPAYRRAYDSWWREQELLHVALALGYTPRDSANAWTDESIVDGGEADAQRKRWCQAALAELGGRLPGPWVTSAYVRLQKASGAEAMLEAVGPGNCGSPGTEDTSAPGDDE